MFRENGYDDLRRHKKKGKDKERDKKSGRPSVNNPPPAERGRGKNGDRDSRRNKQSPPLDPSMYHGTTTN